MTRKEREALEDAIVEDQISKLNAECEAEVAGRFRVIGAVTGRIASSQPNLSNLSDLDQQMLALPKSHPARFLHFYGSAARSRTFTLSEASRLAWAFRSPFGADLLACAETNS